MGGHGWPKCLVNRKSQWVVSGDWWVDWVVNGDWWVDVDDLWVDMDGHGINRMISA